MDFGFLGPDLVFFNVDKKGLLMIAFVFPGQGSQFVSMGKDLSEEFPAAKSVFTEVDDAIDFSLSKLIWDGNEKELMLTMNAQPAIMATSLAVFRALGSEGFDFSNLQCVAGHSLGEYSALCAANALTLADTARVLRFRGKCMQEAVPVGEGAMAAILGLGIDNVEKLLGDFVSNEVCEIANDNDPKQVVISGELRAVRKICEEALKVGARRAIELPVSAPFHCSLMEPAQAKMKEFLDDLSISEPNVPLVSNVSADLLQNPSIIRTNLVKQIVYTVKWRESVLRIKGLGVKDFYEIGPGNVLCNLIKRTAEGVNRLSVSNVKSIKSLKEVW